MLYVCISIYAIKKKKEENRKQRSVFCLFSFFILRNRGEAGLFQSPRRSSRKEPNIYLKKTYKWKIRCKTRMKCFSYLLGRQHRISVTNLIWDKSHFFPESMFVSFCLNDWNNCNVASWNIFFLEKHSLLCFL